MLHLQGDRNMSLKERILYKANDIPIKYKFLIVYVSSILLPMVLIYSIFFTQITDEIEKREVQSLNQSIDRVHADMTTIINGSINISNTISRDIKIYGLLEEDYESPITYYSTYKRELKDKLDRYESMYNNILKISVYAENHTMVNGGGFYYLDSDIKNQAWFISNHEIANKNYLTAFMEYNDPKTYGRTITLRRKLDEYRQYNKYEKYVRIDIDIKKIYDIFHREQMMDFILVNGAGDVVCSTSNRYPLDNSAFYAFHKDDFAENSIILARNIGYKNKTWQIIGITNSSFLLERVKESSYYILLLFIVSILFSTIFIYIITASYNYRIKKLCRHMEKVKNQEFELIKINKGKDEIGTLIDNFNLMTTTINSLVNDVLKLEILDKEHKIESIQAELNFLQSQMNPHFLFNTLNAILVVCNKNQYNDITEIIKYLSKTLRRLLSWDDIMVTIQEEIAFIQMYLKIEKFRFREKFSYALKIDDEVLNCKIPKMSIQPLVENACEHGIQAIKSNGLVQVVVEKRGENIYVKIEDNGVGMNEKDIETIFDNIGNSKRSGSIGIKNVYRRLKLYYGEGLQFEIKSEINSGTAVDFTIPCNSIEAKGEDTGCIK